MTLYARVCAERGHRLVKSLIVCARAFSYPSSKTRAILPRSSRVKIS
jgi:hypothetical protein